MLNNAMAYGHCVGYVQEQEGRLIQSIFPVRKTESDQISTSSRVQLELHTETAFHPYRPDYVLLLCLRGDPKAATTYAEVHNIIKHLDKNTINILLREEFTTSVDQSFRLNGEPDEDRRISVLREDADGRYFITYDAELTRGTSRETDAALVRLADAVVASIKTVTLRGGDLLVLDNARVVHGRTPFAPRYDGTDRWLLRSFVVRDLPPFSERRGNIITTEFGT